MRKIGVCVLAVILFVTNVKAASKCSYAEQVELNELAGKVKASYEVVNTTAYTIDGDEVTTEIFKVSITNLSDKFYVVVENDVEDTKKTYTHANASNGVVSFEHKDLSKVTNYTFKVFSSNNTGCKDENYKTVYLTLPRYNRFHSYSMCEGVENNSLCDKYVTTKEINESDFYERMSSAKSIENDDDNDKTVEDNNESGLLKFIKEYKWYIAGGFGVILLIALLISVNNSKRRRKLGL